MGREETTVDETEQLVWRSQARSVCRHRSQGGGCFKVEESRSKRKTKKMSVESSVPQEVIITLSRETSGNRS